jgi:hypothetical protein
MKIAYITEWNPYEPSGVLQKMQAQVAAWKMAGESVRVFFVIPTRNTPSNFDPQDDVEIIGRISQKNLDRFRFARLGYVNKIISASALRRSVAGFDPDIIYFRHQGPWYPGIGRTLRLAPTVVELNGNLAGAALWGRTSVVFSRLTDSLWKRLITAYVAVSPDIADEYRDTGKSIGIIPNSLPKIPNPLPPTDNSTPAFVFVGSVLAEGGAWHGIEKIFDLAAKLPDSRFEIVGLARTDLSNQQVPDNVRLHGPKYGSDLEAVYRSCDIGLGTLALHRRGMETNSALKPLEYLSFGLPVVLGYQETEPELNSADYTLHIGNHEENVLESIDDIAAFAEKWRGKRVHADLEYLSSAVVERRRLDFLFLWRK